MAADYLVASLQPLTIDGAAPYTMEQFNSMCCEQLGSKPFTALEKRWADIDAEIRNAIASERARAKSLDPAKYRRPAEGCRVFLAARISQAFQEKDPARRELLLDLIRWDAAGELVPASAPLSAAAAFVYGIRLEIVIKRNAISTQNGNATFDRLTAASKIDL